MLESCHKLFYPTWPAYYNSRACLQSII